jgi:AcrR family transcriptional regulator
MVVHFGEPSFTMPSAAKRSRAGSKPRDTARRAFRDGIREAAEGVFVRSGFAATKMADIARASGVAVGTLYNYFDSKELIFEEIMSCRGEEFRAHLESALQIRSPLERLENLVRRTLEYLEQHGALFAILVERGGVAEYDLERLGGEHTERDYLRFLDTLGSVVRAAVEAEQLRRDVPVSAMVAALSGAMNGATYAWLKKKRRGRLSAAADDLLTLFLDGARAR